ncbi:phosphotransferase enzyme family protein-like protein [Aspergillus sclerotiicarbonarius CBS 121057]|uniref:Phosphotransferase enzyme family protein-like protein n=1 Tax=Aspergillus sclerotiicarbonarius (strain CBS 121057 / IBT 28362) TaxID=1448318 RepID=A0A319F4S5_ASPSB|nr:phosphotransferase enzyme family protein-like protein [Aspergillus sclerotiicarbonarius CBS 121057]
MWIVIDETAIRHLPLLYEEFMRDKGLNRLGITALENLASVLLTVRDEQDRNVQQKAACVVHFRLSFPPAIRTNGRSFRHRVRDALANSVVHIQRYYPGLIGCSYIIPPSDDYLAALDIPESLLRDTTILDSATELVLHLGDDIPPEYGGRGVSLSECDCLKNMYHERVDEPATQELLQGHPLGVNSEINTSEESRETTSSSVHQTNHDTKATESAPEPQLIFSETIGPPTIILDPSDLDGADNLCPDKMGARLVWADSNTIVKYGHGVRLAEAEAMHLVSTRTNMPIPKLLSAYILDGTCYIVMSYEEGEPFDKYWDRTSEPERQNALGQLQDYVAQLRTMKGDFIGAIDSSPCRDGIFEGGWGAYDRYSYGPYASEELFTEGTIQALQDRLPPHLRGNRADSESRFSNDEHILYQTVRQLKTMGHSIVFTHGDLHPGNMHVRSDGTVVILDWGLAGYWPDYWEYYRAMFNPPWRRSWDRMVEKFDPPFYIEYAILKNVFGTVWN